MSAAIQFTKKEYAFIEEKFDASKAQVDAYSEDELYDLQDKCADIEVAAIKEAGDDALSSDGETASDIVTKIGNALCGEDDATNDEDM